MLRGGEQEALLESLAGSSSAPAAGSEIAPWWPFGPGPVPIDYPLAADHLAAVWSGPPDALLDTMEPLPVEVGSSAMVELLRPLYEKLSLDSSATMEG